MAKRGKHSNPIPVILAGAADATPGRVANKSDKRTRFEPLAENPVEELCLPVDAIEKWLIG